MYGVDLHPIEPELCTINTYGIWYIDSPEGRSCWTLKELPSLIGGMKGSSLTGGALLEESALSYCLFSWAGITTAGTIEDS